MSEEPTPTPMSEEPTGEPVGDIAVPPPRRPRRRLVIGIGICLGILGWLVLTNMFGLLAFFPHALAISSTLLAAIALFYKDWHNYRNEPVRWLIVGLLVIGCIGTMIAQEEPRKEKKQAKQDADVLRGVAQAARAEQKIIADATMAAHKVSTDAFAKQLSDLHREVANLQTTATTEELKAELASVRTQIETTEAELVKANTPEPKATLVFSFFAFPGPLPPGKVISDPVTSIRAAVKQDGTVRVDLTLINATDVHAVKGQITIVLCDACTFAQEPKNFTKLDGMPDTERYRQFTHVHAKTAASPFAVEVKVPEHLPFFNIGLKHRCQNCVLIPQASLGTVFLDRGLPQR